MELGHLDKHFEKIALIISTQKIDSIWCKGINVKYVSKNILEDVILE